MKNEQSFILEEEVSISLKELAAFLNTSRQFLRQYSKAVMFPFYPLPKPKQEIGFTLLENEHFAQYFQDIKEHCQRQIRLAFRVVSHSVVSPSKSFKLFVSKMF